MNDTYLTRWLEDMAPYEELFNYAATRREITKEDPLAFALTYLGHHLKGEDTGDEITLNEFHEFLIEYAKDWLNPLGTMKEHRDAFIAPRQCGKSTWLFLILPLWAAAHGHLKFVAAFSDSATQAENHLQTLKRELDTNPLLRNDFPELCTTATRTTTARKLADNRGQIHQANDFVFMARGVDSAIAGMKVGSRRPDLIILDDVEPGESNYSAAQVKKRLNTLQTVIFPLNSFARVVLVGTTTMTGSIIHQCVRAAKEEDSPDWIEEENFDCWYFPALKVDPETGGEVSLWPAKWPLEMLQSMKGTRSFSINFMNDPVSVDGTYWQPNSFNYGELNNYGKTILSIDPAVTSKGKSDWTGLSVMSKHPKEPKLYVRYATHVKLSPQELRSRVIHLLNTYPDIIGILIETNQGGDLWKSVLGGLTVKHKMIHQKLSKEIRASQALVHYERNRVFHTEKFTALEDEMTSFPDAAHDDILDSVVTAILWFTSRKTSSTKQSKELSWAG